MTLTKLLNNIRLQLAIIGLTACLLSLVHAIPANAAPVLVNSASNGTPGATSVTATIGTPTANNLLITICGSSANTIVNTPAGYSTAILQLGVPSQAIFYKVSAGNETSRTCSWQSTGNLTIQAYEFSGIALPLDTVFTGSGSGNSGTYSAGSVTPTYENALLVAGFMVNAGTNSTPSWTNSFTGLLHGARNSGSGSTRFHYGGASYATTTTGTYSTAASSGATAAWRGQIVSFRYTVPELKVGIVNASGVPVASPSVALTTLSSNFTCQPATGTLGTSTQRIRVTNTTATPGWSLGIAATNGVSAVWSNGSSTYAYNNPSGAGCTSGQLSASVASGTLAPVGGGCTNTGVSLGANSAFSSGVVNSITVASASNLANTNCSWDITNIPLTQQVPAEQNPGTYSLPLTLTLVAN